MKKTFLLILIIVNNYNSYAQTNIFEANNNVGIGSTNPSSKLEILSPSNGDQLIISRNTLVGGEGPGITFRNIVNSGVLEKIAGFESLLRSGSNGAIAGGLNFFTINH